MREIVFIALVVGGCMQRGAAPDPYRELARQRGVQANAPEGQCECPDSSKCEAALESLAALTADLERAEREERTVRAERDHLRDELALVDKKSRELELKRLTLEEMRLATQQTRVGREACFRSKVCGDLGECDFVIGEGCVPTRDEHCRRSKLCSYLGRCEVGLGYECIASTDADCKRSRACKQHGKCAYSDAIRDCY